MDDIGGALYLKPTIIAVEMYLYPDDIAIIGYKFQSTT